MAMIMSTGRSEDVATDDVITGKMSDENRVTWSSNVKMPLVTADYTDDNGTPHQPRQLTVPLSRSSERNMWTPTIF